MVVEAGARAHGDTYLEETVTGLTHAAGPAVIVTVGAFEMGAFDTEVYVNGVRVAFVQNGPSDFELNLVYTLEATDIVTFVGVQA